MALARNERAQAADERSRAAQARVGRARASLLPDVRVLGDYTRRSYETLRVVEGATYTIQSRNGLEGRVVLDQPLFDAQAWPLLAQARRERDAAAHEALDAKRQLAYDTAQMFLTALNTEQVTQAAAQRLDLARQNHDEIRVRFDAQLVGSNDVTRSQLEVASAERAVVDARGVARIARLSLADLLGTPAVDSLVVPAELLTEAAAPLSPSAPDADAVAAARPDVRAARARVAALRAAAQVPAMRYLPTVGFSAQGWETNESGLSGRDKDWNLGLNLSWSLFDGGGREAERSERGAVARAAGFELALLERRVLLDIESARVTLDSRQASLAQSEVAVDAARRNASEATELYRRGLVRALEVVDANVQLFAAEVARAGAQYALALAYLDLRAALGLPPLDVEDLP